MTRVGKTQTGFTIVELLIVIVVIGILAAITIVAYNGVQQRANNAAKIAAAQQVIKLFKGYVATYGALPGTTTVCATLDSQCTDSAGTVNTTDNSALMTEFKKIGTPPSISKVPVLNSYGMQYIYESSATFNGDAAPIRLEYWLQGDNVNCGVQNIQNSTLPAASSSTTGYSRSYNGRTDCLVRLGLNV